MRMKDGDINVTVIKIYLYGMIEERCKRYQLRFFKSPIFVEVCAQKIS